MIAGLPLSHDELTRRARVVSADVLAARAAEVDTHSRFPAGNIRALHEAGLMAVFSPPELGGHNASVTTYAELAAIMAEGCASTALVWAMHGQQLVSLLDHAADSHGDQLALVGAEGLVIGSVTTDAVYGADLLSTDQALVREGARLRLRRDAPVVTAGSRAGMFLVTMRSGPESPPSETSLVCVLPGDGVVHETGSWDAMGMRGTHSVPMRFDVLVAPERVLDVPFATIARQTMIPVGHVGWASCWLGVARGAAKRVRHALRTHDVGKGATNSDLLFARIADIELSLDLLESIVLRLAAAIDRGREAGPGDAVPEPADPVLVNNVKLAGSRLAFSVVDRLIDLVGLRGGYLRSGSLGLERAFRDVRSASLMFHDDRLFQINGRLLAIGRRSPLSTAQREGASDAS